MINCPNCYAMLENNSNKCKYCDFILEKTEDNKEKTDSYNLSFSKNINKMINDELINYKSNDVKWKDFLNKFVLNKTFDKLVNNFDFKFNDVMSEVKDQLYEKLPVKSQNVTNNQSINQVIQKYFTQPNLNNYDLIALAGIIRYGIEEIVKTNEKKFNIKYDDNYPSFSYRIQSVYGIELKNEVMIHWRNCSAIIHHDDSTELYQSGIDNKIKVLKDAYQFLLNFK